jgi:hypothetical protein
MERGERLYQRLFRNGKFIGKDGGDRGCAPDPAAFFVVIDLPENIYRTPPRRPWRGGDWLVGTKKR